ncbi:MAG: DUF6882 domain-containing protein [Pseudomonadota bacterium]
MACNCGKYRDSGFRGEGFFPRCAECGGYLRDLTPAFQGLVMEACAAVIPTTETLSRRYALDTTCARLASLDDGEAVLFCGAGGARSRAVAHVAGTWDPATSMFTWAWAEDGAQPSRVADQARRVGAHYWLRVLTAPTLLVGETEALHLGMIAAYLTDLPIAMAVSCGPRTTLVAAEYPNRLN